MISLSYKKSGNRMSLHVENPNRVQIRFSKSLVEILGLNPGLSNTLIGNDNQAFTYAIYRATLLKIINHDHPLTIIPSLSLQNEPSHIS